MLRKGLAEFTGTFFLVFAGTGAIVINEELHGVIGHAGIAMAFGLVVMLMIYSIGSISGAHMNPAVTLSLAVNQTLPFKQVPVYIVSQLGGAFAASALLHLFFPQNKMLGATLPFDNSWGTAFIFEFILTFLLVIVIVRVIAVRELNAFAGIIIGSAVFLDALFGGPVCGASMNPARSLAPALLSGSTQHLWVYILSPILAAVIAVLVNKLIFTSKIPE